MALITHSLWKQPSLLMFQWCLIPIRVKLIVFELARPWKSRSNIQGTRFACFQSFLFQNVRWTRGKGIWQKYDRTINSSGRHSWFAKYCMRRRPLSQRLPGFVWQVRTSERVVWQLVCKNGEWSWNTATVPCALSSSQETHGVLCTGLVLIRLIDIRPESLGKMECLTVVTAPCQLLSGVSQIWENWHERLERFENSNRLFHDDQWLAKNAKQYLVKKAS